MRSSIALIACLWASLQGPGAQAQVRDEDFFGTWIPIEDTIRSCVTMGEGAHFTIHRNYYAPGDGAPCADAKTWLRTGKLRVSATCEGEEYEFRATTREFSLEKPSLLSERKPGSRTADRYVACEMPRHILKPSQVMGLSRVIEEIDKAEAAVPGDADYTERTAKVREEIARKSGYTSSSHLDEVRHLVEDILRFGDEEIYLSLRHQKANVDLVRSNKELLAPLLKPSEPADSDRR